MYSKNSGLKGGPSGSAELKVYEKTTPPPKKTHTKQEITYSPNSYGSQ